MNEKITSIVVTKENFHEATKMVREWIGKNDGSWKVYSAQYDNSKKTTKSLYNGTYELYAGDECYNDMWCFDEGATIKLVTRQKYPQYWVTITPVVYHV